MNENEMMVLSPVDSSLPSFPPAGPLSHECDSLATVILI